MTSVLLVSINIAKSSLNIEKHLLYGSLVQLFKPDKVGAEFIRFYKLKDI